MAKSAEEVSVLLATAILPGVFDCLGFAGEGEIEEFFRSDLYEKLRNPETGLWHLSAATLADMYRRELAGQDFLDPEEQS